MKSHRTRVVHALLRASICLVTVFLAACGGGNSAPATTSPTSIGTSFASGSASDSAGVVVTTVTSPPVSLDAPLDVTVDGGGNLYLIDAMGAIRRVTSQGAASYLVGGPSASGVVPSSDMTLYQPQGLVADVNGTIYVTDTYSNTIRKITPAGVVSILAGSPNQTGSNDGIGPAATFFKPWGIARDTAGNLYVTDAGNSTIRMVTPTGVVTTLAGTAGQIGSADGMGAAARFNSPQRIAVDLSGNVYVADSGNSAIRKITADGVVTTIAGQAGVTGNADGIGASARFKNPGGIAVDKQGNLLVADTGNATIRKITSSGEVTTFAGRVGDAGSQDGNASVAQFYGPSGLAVDAFNNVFVADTYNGNVRKITPTGIVSSISDVIPFVSTSSVTTVSFSPGHSLQFTLPADARGTLVQLWLDGFGGGRNVLSVYPGTTMLLTLPSGTAYSITIPTQPTGLSCSVQNGVGTMGSTQVNAVVSCQSV